MESLTREDSLPSTLYALPFMVHQKLAKSILNKHKQRDSWFLTEYSINPYEGCNCNCLYCYIRGSKYGENMEDGLAVKSNAIEILEKQLASRAKRSQHGFVAVGSATDAYMNHENKFMITRRCLELLLKYRFPVFISTKRDGVLRDVDLLKEIEQQAILPNDLSPLLKGLILSVSISTMNEEISGFLEPGALTPKKRLDVVRELKSMGFLVGVNAIPILPYISDSEEELGKIISAATEAGADYVLTGGLTLFGNLPADSKTLYYKFLQKFAPDLIYAYDKLYGNKFYPPKSYQSELSERANKLCMEFGIRNTILKTLPITHEY